MTADKTQLRREDIYRNSRFYYGGLSDASRFSGRLIDFCRAKAGRRILDFGCASGNYCLELARCGFDCVGADINEEYVRAAARSGVRALVMKDCLPFADKSFDTVILFEILEHVQDPIELLRQAKRVVRKNVLLTVPNNTGFFMLKRLNLTYEHMLEEDHMNFFTKDSLSILLKRCFDKYLVTQEEPLAVQNLFPWYVRKPISLGIRMGLVKPSVYFRLYAECLV